MKQQNKSIYNLLDVSLSFMLQGEEIILDNLKKVQSLAKSDKLRDIFDNHINETEKQIKRLEDCIKSAKERSSKNEDEEKESDDGLLEKGKKVLKAIGKTLIHQKSESVEGVIKEGEYFFKEYEDTDLHDYVLATSAQAIEMGEMAAYNTLISLAKASGSKEIPALLNETLQEEQNAYDALKEFAETEVQNTQKSA